MDQVKTGQISCATKLVDSMPFDVGFHAKHISEPLKHTLSLCGGLVERVSNFTEKSLNAL